MLKKRILASSMASVMALSSFSVVAFAEDLDMEDTVKKYGETVTEEELQKYYDSLKSFVENELDNYGTVQGEYFSATYDHVEMVLDNDKSTGKDYTAAYQMLKSVKEGLQKKSASELKALIKDYQKTYDRNNILNEDDGFNDLIYSQESFANFTTSFEDAEFYVDSDDSRNITDAYYALQRDFKALDPNDDVSKSDFRKVMKQYQDIRLEMSNYESWRRGTYTHYLGDKKEKKDKPYSELLGNVLGVEDEVTDNYDRLTQAKNISRTTDENIVKAFDKAEKAVKEFNSWKVDSYKTGSKSNAASLVKKYHNRLVETFNPGAIAVVLDIAAINEVGESYATMEEKDITSLVGLQNNASLSINGGTLDVTYDPAKHTLTATKEFYLVKENATGFAVGTTGADIADYMFKDAAGAQAFINGRTNLYTEQRVAAKTDMLQYFGYEWDHTAVKPIPETIKEQSVKKASTLATLLTGEDAEGEETGLMSPEAIAAATDVQVDAAQPPVIVSAVVKNLMSAASPAATFAAPSTDDDVLYYIEKKGGLAADADAAADAKVDAHNKAVKDIEDAVTAFLNSKVGYAIEEGDLDTARATFVALYNKYVTDKAFISVAAEPEAKYNTIEDTAAADSANYVKRTAASGVLADYTIDEALADIMKGSATGGDKTIDYLAVKSGSTLATAQANVTAHNTALDAIKTACETYNSSVATALTALQTAYTNATTADAANATGDAKNGELLAVANPWVTDQSGSGLSTSSDYQAKATSPVTVTIPTGIILVNGATAATTGNLTFTEIEEKNGASNYDADKAAAHNLAVQTLKTAYEAYEAAVGQGTTAKPGAAKVLKDAYDAQKDKLINHAAITAVVSNPFVGTISQNDTYKWEASDSFTIDATTAAAIKTGSGATTVKNYKLDDPGTASKAEKDALKTFNDAYASLKQANKDLDTIKTNFTGKGAAEDTQDGNGGSATLALSRPGYPGAPAAGDKVGALKEALSFRDLYLFIESTSDKFDDGDNQDDAQAALAILTDGGKTIPTAKGSTQEWTLIWRRLAYALEDKYPEDKVTKYSLNDLKKKIDEAQDYLDKTGDASLFSAKHNAVLDMRANALDWYRTAKATTGWKSSTKVQTTYYSANGGALIEKVYKDLDDQIKALKKWYEGFLYSYDDIRSKINEVAEAIDKGEVKNDDLTKALYECANLLATHEASDLLNAGDADDNAVFDDEGLFQPNNRLKTAKGETIKDPNQKEKDLKKAYENLKDLLEKAQNPSSDVNGDVDGDGQITALDVAAFVDELYKKPETVDAKFDLDGDGKLTALDVAAAVDLYYNKKN